MKLTAASSNTTCRSLATALLLASAASVAEQPTSTPGINDWLPARQIDAVNPGSVAAVADRGGVYTVWLSDRGSASNLGCARHTWGAATWIPCERFGEVPAARTSTTRLVAAPNGDMALVWDNVFDLFSKRFTVATDSWSDPLPVDARVGVLLPEVGLQFDSTGTASIAYDGVQAGVSGIFASRSTGLEWSPADLISTASTIGGLQVHPLIVSLDGGAAVATWLDQSGTTTAAFVSRSFVGGVWRSPKVIRTGTFRPEAAPVLVSLGDRALLAFVQAGPRESITLMSATYDLANDRWNTATTLHGSTNIVSSMALCADDQGNAMLISSIAAPPGNADLIAHHYHEDTWRAFNPLLPPLTGLRTDPKCAMAPSGHMLVTWLDSVGRPGNEVRNAWATRYEPNDNGWRLPQQLSTSGTASAPIVTLHDEIRGMALWKETANAQSQLWYRRFLR